MPGLSPAAHLGAILVALVMVFGVRVQDLDAGAFLGIRDVRGFSVYTPVFPGLAHIDQHEIFSPRFAGTKKIVLLGGSPVDSVGCDFTWSRRESSQRPNAAYSCSIAGQMNELLSAAGVTNWRVFNLARNGAGLTPMLYVYAQIRSLQPEIVIYGDDFPFLFLDNADANDLTAAQYAELEEHFAATAQTAGAWKAYHEHLVRRGLRPRFTPASWTDRPRMMASDLIFGRDDSASAVRRATIGNLLVAAFAQARDNTRVEAPLLPIRFAPLRNWEVAARAEPRPSSDDVAEIANPSPDPGFAYSQGLTLISTLQRLHGGTFWFTAFPDYDRRGDAEAAATLTAFGEYWRAHHVLFKSHVDLEMRPVYETYDGVHHTLYGNRIIAATLLSDLRASGLLEPSPGSP
jgi:hypothetical protein